ncbi:MAG: HD domain-containing protein [Tissierellia bacterium]|nr:HD domain-containing protein [Tissierellia bacterium]
MKKYILNKILLSDKPSEGIYKLIETGEILNIIPEIMEIKGFNQHTPYHDKDVLDHTMAVLDSIKPKLNLRMAALLHDISKPECFTIDENGRGHFYGHHIKSAQRSVEILNRLGYNGEFIEDVRILIRYHYIKNISKKENGIRNFIEDVGIHRLDDMFELNIADIKGKSNSHNFDAVLDIKKKCEEFLKITIKKS